MEDEVIIYNWNCVGDTLIVRSPLRQLRCRGACLFAALARHMEYQLRIACAPQKLIATNLINQSVLVNQYQNSRPKNYTTSRVLGFFHNNGITLCNGLHIQVIFGVQYHVFANENDGISQDVARFRTVIYQVGKWLKRGTVMGKMVIRSDYREDGRRVYLCAGERRMERTHIVVIIGLFPVSEMLGRLWNCPPGWYIKYQDSKGPGMIGLLGGGTSLAHPRALLRMYQASSDQFLTLKPRLRQLYAQV